MITLHVLSFGELYASLLSTLGLFMKQDSFTSLLRMAALIGIIMTSAGYLKARDPFVYAKWFVVYVLVSQVLILPKTAVLVEDIAGQKQTVVRDVPVLVAVVASMMTRAGVGLASAYDDLQALPEALQYTQSGMLSGARMMQHTRHFVLLNPELKQEVNDFFELCVAGDVALNHKYTVQDLNQSEMIWNLIRERASPIRLTRVRGESMSCHEAVLKLQVKLVQEAHEAFIFYGRGFSSLFSMEHLLKTAYIYYQGVDLHPDDLMRQIQLIHMIDSLEAKAPVDMAWSWTTFGQKIVWFLPMLHTLLTGLLLVLCPLILVMMTLPGGGDVLKRSLQFFVALQLWPVAFAVLNAAMTRYGQGQVIDYGGITRLNYDAVVASYEDVLGVTGYCMLVIPFLAKGLVSSLSTSVAVLMPRQPMRL